MSDVWEARLTPSSLPASTPVMSADCAASSVQNGVVRRRRDPRRLSLGASRRLLFLRSLCPPTDCPVDPKCMHAVLAPLLYSNPSLQRFCFKHRFILSELIVQIISSLSAAACSNGGGFHGGNSFRRHSRCSEKNVPSSLGRCSGGGGGPLFAQV